MFASDLARDVRVAFRSLLKARVLTFVVVLTLAVAIGVNTAIFSVVQSVLLRPLPYLDEGRIVRVAATVYPNRGVPTDRGNSFSPAGYFLFANNNRSFERFGGYLALPQEVPLTGDGPPLQVDVGQMALSAFEVLGVFPERGRLPTAEENARGGPPVVLLSHDLWVTRYGADPSIVGRTIHLDGTSRAVVGVMPAGYNFPSPEIDVWIPLQLSPESTLFAAHFINAIARLAPGVTIDAAVEDGRSLVARFNDVGYGPTWFESVFDGGAVVRPLRDYIVGDSRQPLLVLLGTVGVVLLIACSNVANLLLVRAEGRRRESAVRMALGSSRARLAKHVLIESALLALMGGTTGTLLAYAGTRALVSVAPSGIPRLDEIGVSGSALALTALVSMLAGLLFGVLPAVRSSSTQTLSALRSASRSDAFGHQQHRSRKVLVTTQIALGVVLVVGAGLMARSYQALSSVDPGFSADRVLTFRVSPLSTKYGEPEAIAQLYERLTERLEAVPGVVRVGAIDTLPLTDGGEEYASVIEEFPSTRGELAPAFNTRRAAPGYFETMGIPVVEGRTFTRDDHNQRVPAVIISESVKARYWPNESALGKRITVAERIPTRVVGVVGDVRDAALDVIGEQFLYLPILDASGGGVEEMTLTVRTAVEPLSVVSAIRGVIAELDGDLPMAEVRTMERVLDDSMSRTSFTMSLLVIGALIALFLGAVGIYGALSHMVSQRTPEIGIRTALGASPQQVRRMILSQGMLLAGVGVLIGLVAAVMLRRVIGALLYEVSPLDPVTLVAASVIFMAVAVLASLLPAARAAGASPVDALRSG